MKDAKDGAKVYRFSMRRAIENIPLIALRAHPRSTDLGLRVGPS